MSESLCDHCYAKGEPVDNGWKCKWKPNTTISSHGLACSCDGFKSKGVLTPREAVNAMLDGDTLIDPFDQKCKCLYGRRFVYFNERGRDRLIESFDGMRRIYEI